ncbi:MAG: shikimate dehydrogenase [Flavobacteriales bacterium]
MIRFGLIGRTLSHSFSERWFTEKFKTEGRADHRYELHELTAITAFPDLLRTTEGLRGLNVTVPYKQQVIPYLDALAPTAAAVGAVNTIDLHNGRAIGHNTDVEGFRTMVAPMLNGARPRALVLGTGGASRAVVFVLRELGIKFRTVSRGRDRGDLTWDLMHPAIIKASELIINATPLGMFPAVDEAPALPYEAIDAGHTLIDLVYNPAETRFLALGKARGARVCNGMPMLEAQAEASWRIWNADR